MGRLDALYREVWDRHRRRAGMRELVRDFRVSFRPYAGFKANIRHRDGHFDVRISDVLQDAPMSVHESLAMDLVGQLHARYQLRPQDRAAYDEWVHRPENLARHSEARRQRGRRQHLGPQGDHYDLETMYRRLNREYFDALLPTVRLGWSVQRSRTRFGYHDGDLDLIVLNRRLDSPEVPEDVVAFVLYHEMLHVKHGIGRRDDGRRSLHPPAFQADERRFPGQREADAFLTGLAGQRPRKRLRNTRS